MTNRYGNLTPSKKISEDFQNINIGFDRVQADMDANKTAADDHIANADIHVTKAQKAEWDSKAAGGTATELTSHIDDQVVHVTQADHDKLDSIEDGAEVNQNAFAKVNDIAAADPSSQFYIVGGIGITITTNPNNGEITITATGDAAPGAHGSTHTEHGADPIPTATLTEGGLLSAAQLAEIVTHGELLEEQGEAITALETRLDTADTDEITLQPGLQVVSAAKDARFKLGSIKGKSEINGSGRIGIVGVENPYVIRYGTNLLPPFYEWTVSASQLEVKSVAPYEIQIIKNIENIGTFLVKSFPVIPRTEYSLSIDHNIEMGIFNTEGSLTIADYTTAKTLRFNSGDNSNLAVWLRVNVNKPIGVYFAKKPMLTIGTELKTFQPREDSMLAFQTELHANPTDGSDPDVLFEQGGEYKKLPKWKKVMLDGSLPWVRHVFYPDTKTVMCPTYSFGSNSSLLAFATKYNGINLPWVNEAAPTVADRFFIDVANIVISIANTDSGWGPDYEPTADEIKAYFWGWSMCNQDGSVPYDGTSNKRWKQIGKQGVADTSTLPTSQAPNRNPYNLLYRLAKEVVEPVVSEGCLTLSEGDNVVEVGTGIVLRERAKPENYVGQSLWALVNHKGAPSSILTYKLDKFLHFYKDDKPFYGWRVQQVPGDAYGNAYLDRPWSEFDQSASYSVTYLKLDKSPIAPIFGVVAVNEKAQLSDLTAGVAEALHGVSVLFNKKAEKDAPGWITLTLLNAWIVYGGYPTLCIRKDSNNLYFDGLIKGGVYSPGTTIAHLPDGYSPRVTKVVSVPCLTGEGMYSIAHLFIRSDGTIAIFSAPGNEYLSFAGLSIPLN